MWIRHPNGKIAVYVKDPVGVIVADEVVQDEPKKRSKKK